MGISLDLPIRIASAVTQAFSYQAKSAPFSDGGGRVTSDALEMLRNEFVVEIADTNQAVEEAYRLRYQVYCVERGYESGSFGLEVDQFDEHSRHVILRHSPTAQAIGTVRLVLPVADRGERDFPIEKLCPESFDHLPIDTTAEISRFAISKQYRGIGEISVAFLRVGLMKGILQVSREYGLTHWCALMDRSLLRLLKATAIHFRPHGALVEHRGLRQPACGLISDILDHLRRQEAVVWDFVTDGGRLA